MRVTPPISIVDSKLTSSTAVEPHAPAAYAAGTTYALGDIVSVAADFTIYESLASANLGNTPKSSPLWWRIIGPTETAYDVGATYGLGDTVSSAATHRCYESLAAGNIGNPLPVLPETATDKWRDVGPTNKWAMFDATRNTQTVQASPLTVVLAPGVRCNTLGLTGLVANSVTISATSVTGGGRVYPKVWDATKTYAADDCVTNAALTTSYQSLADDNFNHAVTDAAWWTAVAGAVFDLSTREVTDGYDYCFEPFSTKASKVLFEIPSFLDIIVTVTLGATSGNVKCGSLVLGTYIYIGTAIGRAGNNGMNFSTIDRDAWGNATLVPRRTVPRLNVTTVLHSARVTKVLNARNTLNAVPALWTGLDDDTEDFFEMTTILGVFKQLEPENWEGVQDKARVTVEVEEI